MSQSSSPLLREEITELLQKWAVERVQNPGTPSFYSCLSLSAENMTYIRHQGAEYFWMKFKAKIDLPHPLHVHKKLPQDLAAFRCQFIMHQNGIMKKY